MLGLGPPIQRELELVVLLDSLEVLVPQAALASAPVRAHGVGAGHLCV